MQGGGWIVVLVIIALAITTGFVVSSNAHLTFENETAHVALENSVGMVSTLSVQATSSAAKINNLETEIENLEATQTAVHNSQLKKEQGMIATLSAAQADKDHAQATISAQGRALAFMNTPAAPDPCQSQADAYRPTPMPDARIPVAQAGMSLPWLPTLGFGLFSAAAVAVYRMLKIDDRTRRGLGTGDRRAAGERAYQSDMDAVYVKMSRREASRYARERAKK
jgi:outer membrane murein-binding lipoprotein Lpp